MKTITPFSTEDVKLIKWPIAFFVFSIVLACGIYFSIDYLNTQARRNLSIAQNELQRARSSVEFIEEEEATIIEYIDRYQLLSNAGIVDAEDRLQTLENIAEIREQNSLFPISVTIGKQDVMRLQYDQDVREPGQPIDLNFSTIDVSLPLLHEEDLTRMLQALKNSPGLFQVQHCEINLDNRTAEDFYVLAQHQSAACNLLWYTFDLTPPEDNGSSGFL